VTPLRFDEIGYWSEVKLEIVRKYASAYSTIMANQPAIRGHVYIDAFAGAGQHRSKRTGDMVPGSPMNALRIEPPFTEFHFIDLDQHRAAELKRLAGQRPDIFVYEEDCNDVLLRDVFPRCTYSAYRRALCLLDPYGLNVRWDVLKTAGQMRSIEVFYNFMIMDVNMNVLWRGAANVNQRQAARMTAAWGDESWRDIAYVTERDLFGDVERKAGNELIAEAFRKRLHDEAGFEFVARPMPMRNSRGAVVYYLYFASQNAKGAKIVGEIFDKYRGRGA
jgi:three-Cys-motif partner protein